VLFTTSPARSRTGVFWRHEVVVSKNEDEKKHRE
jgi:hypothetical protein